MASINDLFVHPESLRDVQKALGYQIKMVEALEHAKDRLSKTKSLDANTLAKCGVFVQHVNRSDTPNNFYSEVSKLNLNELAFSLISFEDRRLKTLLDSFKASDIRKYVEKQQIQCLHRSEIFTRIKFILSACEGSRFDAIYRTVLQMRNISESEMARDNEPEPKTAAEEPNALKLLGVRRESFKNVFTEHVANNAHLMTVESRYPRGTRGDAFISFDIESDRGPIAASLDAFLDRDTPVDNIPEPFGDTIATSIDRCDLRNWEKRKGYVDTTNCVKVKMIYHVEIRLYDDATLANILHS
ncbi:uncharacterized protein PV06_11848 [Exophiala oligosperma]|uniref:Uncharacterized protein n=1 Tax=Exophiala oligosperma TaxID=215243 RepID=A0A0D2BE78_9EURO|nr:uncharacterized protein PV06_11848 [Exophiala oligosperma]KIW35807.1 hypothetical protein PV06_11848 [Exophiala oligosperma]